MEKIKVSLPGASPRDHCSKKFGDHSNYGNRCWKQVQDATVTAIGLVRVVNQRETIEKGVREVN